MHERRWRTWWFVAGWVVAWLPISTVFPSNPHLPIPTLAMPIMAPFLPLLGGVARRDLTQIYLPAALFWLVTFAIVGSLRYLRKR
jgi:hypothetical protein